VPELKPSPPKAPQVHVPAVEPPGTPLTDVPAPAVPDPSGQIDGVTGAVQDALP
jgi:hypothetical protein